MDSVEVTPPSASNASSAVRTDWSSRPVREDVGSHVMSPLSILEWTSGDHPIQRLLSRGVRTGRAAEVTMLEAISFPWRSSIIASGPSASLRRSAAGTTRRDDASIQRWVENRTRSPRGPRPRAGQTPICAQSALVCSPGAGLKRISDPWLAIAARRADANEDRVAVAAPSR